MPNDMIACVLCFTEEISSAHITILVRECRKKILHMIGNRTYYPGIGECNRYSSLTELNLAWEEACKDLSYQIYYRAEAKKPRALKNLSTMLTIRCSCSRSWRIPAIRSRKPSLNKLKPFCSH